MSREMVTAVCQVLGTEPLGNETGKLDQLRYPPQPASRAVSPNSAAVKRIIQGDLGKHPRRALDLATLLNRPDVDVGVDGHVVVTRHLAILAMTGAGKTWAARRLVEQIAAKNYPMVIFDPRGDYTGLADVAGLKLRTKLYFARFPILDEDTDKAADIVSALGYELTPTMRVRFGEVFDVAQQFVPDDEDEAKAKLTFLAAQLSNPRLFDYGLQRNLWLVANLAEAAESIIRLNDPAIQQPRVQQLTEWGWSALGQYNKRDAETLGGIKKRTRKAAMSLAKMEKVNRKRAGTAGPLPTDRKELVGYGNLSVISLAGYTSDFQATIYRLVVDDLFSARVNGDLKLPVLLVLEEAHNFVPGKANTYAEQQSIEITKQIAQEGRKFGIGLVMISQRPSRLDETTLSQCNSYIILRMVNPADQSFVRRVVESLSEDEARILPSLSKGEAILSGQFVNFPVLAKIKPPVSQGEREEGDAFEDLERANKDL
jgi:DNA helicase HerA-like ATPase